MIGVRTLVVIGTDCIVGCKRKIRPYQPHNMTGVNSDAPKWYTESVLTCMY